MPRQCRRGRGGVSPSLISRSQSQCCPLPTAALRPDQPVCRHVSARLSPPPLSPFLVLTDFSTSSSPPRARAFCPLPFFLSPSSRANGRRRDGRRQCGNHLWESRRGRSLRPEKCDKLAARRSAPCDGLFSSCPPIRRGPEQLAWARFPFSKDPKRGKLTDGTDSGPPVCAPLALSVGRRRSVVLSLPTPCPPGSLHHPGRFRPAPRALGRLNRVDMTGASDGSSNLFFLKGPRNTPHTPPDPAGTPSWNIRARARTHTDSKHTFTLSHSLTHSH